MAQVLATSLAAAGGAATLNAASGGGDTVECGDNVVLTVYNGSTTTVLTIVTPGTSADGDAVADYVSATIPANSGTYSSAAGFQVQLKPRRFADPTTNLATISWSATTNVKFTVVRLG